VTLPSFGMIRVHDDTRRLRRLLRPLQQLDPNTGQPVSVPRARILFATCSRHGNRWYVSLNVHAPDLHKDCHHPPRSEQDHGGWVGLDRGLAAFVVAATADGAEVGRWQAPKPLQRSLVGLRRRSRALSRTKPGSRNRAKATRRLSHVHARIADTRRSFLHEVSSQLVQTHDRLCLERLAVANLVRNKQLARAIGDASWAVNWATSKRGAVGRCWPPTAGCPRPGPARAAGSSSSNWGWPIGSFAATAAGW
jgi:putative transposase